MICVKTTIKDNDDLYKLGCKPVCHQFRPRVVSRFQNLLAYEAKRTRPSGEKSFRAIALSSSCCCLFLINLFQRPDFFSDLLWSDFDLQICETDRLSPLLLSKKKLHSSVILFLRGKEREKGRERQKKLFQ